MLRAVDAKRNVRRSWSCRVGRDLLGDLIVSVTFGRTGTDGRTIRYAMADEASSERFMMKALRRRAGSERRCGAAYHLVEAMGFGALPPQVMEARDLQAWRMNKGDASGIVT